LTIAIRSTEAIVGTSVVTARRSRCGLRSTSATSASTAAAVPPFSSHMGGEHDQRDRGTGQQAGCRSSPPSVASVSSVELK
jgi:hypothetical protein